MITISINYTCKYQLSFSNHYVWTLCGKCFNRKSGRLIKQVYKSGCIGYIIESKFYSLKYLRNHLEPIPLQEYCPI